VASSVPSRPGSTSLIDAAGVAVLVGEDRLPAPGLPWRGIDVRAAPDQEVEGHGPRLLGLDIIHLGPK
jgi:hypothetical protein